MSGRKPAFDPARLDNDLDDLLPPAPSVSQPIRPAASPTLVAAQPPTSVAPSTPPEPKPAHVAEEPPPRTPRGTAGRPPGSATGTARPTITAVRIPKPLYDTVVHDLLGTSVERPSYAQVIAWTCEDHRDDVVEELTRALKVAGREPRGRKLAVDGVPLTLRFKPEERDALDDVIRRAGGQAARVTRTAGVVAALRVAVKHGIAAPSQS